MEKRQKYIGALKKFVTSIKRDKNIIGILVCGSLVENRLDKNSDIDIHLILNENCDYRERGNIWLDGIEIEYFKNPPKQIRSYFKKEINPHTADIFANGEVLFKKSKIIDDLKKEAKRLLRKRPKSLKREEIEISKYLLDDLRKDLEDCFDKNEKYNFLFVKNKIIEECIDILFWLKIKRRKKGKILHNQLLKIDPKFCGLLEVAILERELKMKGVKNLIEYTETLLGGKRPENWILKSDLDF